MALKIRSECSFTVRIGEALCLSTHTVKSHMHNLLRKTGAANRAEAALRFHAGQDLPG